MKKILTTALLIICIFNVAGAQSSIVKAFVQPCDSLAKLIHDRTGVSGILELKAVMRRGNTLDFYFTESLGDFPWRKDDAKWLKSTLKSLFPDEYRNFKVGEIHSRRVPFNKLYVPELTFNGKPSENSHRTRPDNTNAMVREIGSGHYNKGLSGRHIALWQSHGRYFDQNAGRWLWQRPCLFQTCEDMFTQGFVLPYLVPMLENAGAYVLLPRERDIQKNEIIADNDPSNGARGKAAYTENGSWSGTGTGFADPKLQYEDTENPFSMGTARKAVCAEASERPTSSATWIPEIPEKGEYAVYVSYRSLPSSTTSAHYTVHHLGGTSEFLVNQKMGGGTWIYLGTFTFDKGNAGYVTLDNSTPKNVRQLKGTVVTADAVRFGGGMGNIARSVCKSPEDTTSVFEDPTTSGLPRSAEAARYYLQWAGADSTIFHQNDGQNDYKDDFMSRGDWVEWISRGSRVNPKAAGGLGIPIDLSFGFHSDAGVTPGDSLVGTLAIYTYRSEGKTELPSGESRLTSRMFADIVQSQIVNDLQFCHDSLWTRRQIWDRGYRESRTPSSPAMLLELLSHQNFSDMKYGLDPSFKFDVSRAVYKGMLKYLSNRYGVEYAVQPLPVEDMGVNFGNDGKAIVSWKPVEDPLEPTAVPKGYILYTRADEGAFDNGIVLEQFREQDGRYYTEIDLIPGKIMSFRIAAFNDGGRSFPSETVSIGIPESGEMKHKILVINNFDRISGPAFIDGESYAGFDNDSDSGVPYVRDITFVGQMHDFKRSGQWISNDRPGFGASYSDMAGKIVAGNTFDYAYVHGCSILKAGYPFHSCSNERFCSDPLIRSESWAVDLICGKQVTVKAGLHQKFMVFPLQMQSALKDFAQGGGNILVSGAYIGTDIWDEVFPVEMDSTFREASQAFAKDILGYRYVTGKASRKGMARPVGNKSINGLPQVAVVNEMNSETYCVESPDGIAPANADGNTIYRYTDSGISAGVAYEGDGYRCVSLGFPIEALQDAECTDDIIRITLKYFER